MTRSAPAISSQSQPKTHAVWHPFTQHGLGEEVIAIERAEGAWLYAQGGRKILDAISSWWVITHGHGEPHIRTAVQAQADKLDQVIFAGFTHAPAERVARELLKLAPDNLQHVFYSDSGSTAVEVALKMAVGAQAHYKTGRNRILAFEHAYHGDTIGAMAVGGRGVFSTPYEQLLFAVDRIPVPLAGQEDECLAVLDAYLAHHGPQLAGFLFEPLLLGAGGMLTYAPVMLHEIVSKIKAAGGYLIADEVLTGWGRTGSLFACEQAGVQPDILCTGKGLTGGFLPLAATLASAEVFDAFYSPDPRRQFFHSSSFTANPLACAAAAANIELWSDNQPLQQVRRITAYHAEALTELRQRFKGLATRQMGSVAALEFPVRDQGYFAGLGLRLRQRFIRRGFLLRPLGNVVYILPPYCITEAELGSVYQEITLALGDEL